MTFKISMVFRDGDHTAIAQPQETDIRPCLSDPVIARLVKHFLKEHNQTQGLVIIWGNDDIQTINVIDATKIFKTPEGET